MIYDHLLRLPGDHFRSVVRSLNVGVGTARHHLGVLVTAGVLRADKGRGRLRYYAVGNLSEPERNTLYEEHWNLRDVRSRVLTAVARLDRPTASCVARNLGISRQLAAYHLRRLSDANLVRREGNRFTRKPGR